MQKYLGAKTLLNLRGFVILIDFMDSGEDRKAQNLLSPEETIHFTKGSPEQISNDHSNDHLNYHLRHSG